MAGTNSTLENRQVYAGVFGCIMVLGLPLNAASLWILLRRHSLKSPTAVLMVNLAVSDLLLIISLPMRIYVYATGTWPLGTHACTALTMLYRNSIRSSCIFIISISVDRMLAVVYPLRTRHLRTSTNTWKAAALIWLFLLVLNVPEGVAFSKYSKSNTSTCFEFQHNKKTVPLVYLQFVLIIIMLMVNIVCTILVSWTLHRRLSDFANVKNKVRVMLIYAMNSFMFAVCFLPAPAGLLTNSSVHVLMPLVCLASVNCCLDPLLYYFSFDGFWRKNDDVDQA